MTPGMITKFKQVDDPAAIEILEVIYRDEIGHVRIGNDWYGYLCQQQGIDPEVTFHDLVKRYMGGKLRGPFNWPARIEAGFQPSELGMLERDF